MDAFLINYPLRLSDYTGDFLLYHSVSIPGIYYDKTFKRIYYEGKPVNNDDPNKKNKFMCAWFVRKSESRYEPTIAENAGQCELEVSKTLITDTERNTKKSGIKVTLFVREPQFD